MDKGQYAGLSPITAGWRTHWSYLSAREPRYVLAETPTTGATLVRDHVRRKGEALAQPLDHHLPGRGTPRAGEPSSVSRSLLETDQLPAVGAARDRDLQYDPDTRRVELLFDHVWLDGAEVPCLEERVVVAVRHKLRSIRAGTYRIKIEDKATIHNFRLRGPGINRATSVPRRSEQIWTVKLRKGTYRFLCDPHAATMRGTFRVT